MCYDISFTVKVNQLSDYFPDLIFDEQFELNFDAGIHIMGHAYGEHPIIYRNRESNKLHCKLMQWGCIPFYVKELSAFVKQRAIMLNARSERILDDAKSYWFKIKNRRCLIPISAFYEYRAVKGWKKKVPYHIGLKVQEVFFLPGLYSVAELPNKETGELERIFTYTIITTDATDNEVMRNIHNDGDNRYRMPLMLPFDLSNKWLQGELTEEEYRSIINYKMPGENLEYYTVDTIRSPKQRADGKNKNELFEWAKLPALGEMNP